MASGSVESSDGRDAELDELLDSALDDFDKTSVPSAPEAEATSSSAKSGAEKPPLLEDSKFFETLFEGDMATQAKDEWEKAMAELAQEEPELLQHFQKLSEAAGKVDTQAAALCQSATVIPANPAPIGWGTICSGSQNPPPLTGVPSAGEIKEPGTKSTDVASQQEFTSCLKDTLSGLAKNADTLQSTGLAGEDLVKALEGMGLDEGGGEGGGDDGNILPIMQSIMQNLLSKDVLYPSLKEITAKYPEWLDANKPTLSPDEYKRYEQQAKVMGDICKNFEKEEEGDGDKENTFESILELMQQLQDLGQPPKELAGDAPPGLNFDMESLNLPGMAGGGAGAAEQCSVM